MNRALSQLGVHRKPMLGGVDLSNLALDRGMTWDAVRPIRDATSMKLLIKGIVPAEDAEFSVDRGLDG